jgi:hypothetical protein
VLGGKLAPIDIETFSRGGRAIQIIACFEDPGVMQEATQAT